jgi:hypothetical protein
MPAGKARKTIPQPFTICTITGCTDTKPQPENTTWAGFVESCKTPDVRGELPLDKYLAAEKSVRDGQKDGRAIIAGTYCKPNTRKQVHLASLALVTLDLDEGDITFDQLCERLAGFEAVCFTSYSHSAEKPKFRAYIPLLQPIASDIEATLGRIIDFFTDRVGSIDPACRKPGQLFYAPACPPGGEQYYQFRQISGSPIDTTDFPAPPKNETVKQEKTTTGDRPGDDFNNRGTWSEILEPLGWSLFYHDHWTRPGKSFGVSASVLDAGLYIHSSAPEVAPFESGKTYTKFGAYALTKHDGDHKAAARDLAVLGYGDHASQNGTGDGTVEEPIPEYVAKLNLKNFVTQNGGKTIVCRESYNAATKRDELTRSSFTDFRNFHNNRKVATGQTKDGHTRYTPLGTAWLNNPNRRQYDGIVMAPDGDVEGYYNLWRGFAVQPASGSWDLMKQHIFKVICDGNKEVCQYLLMWLARMVQQPGKPGEVAIVLQGGRGTGKGQLGNALCRLMGQHAVHVTNGRHVTGNFNAHLEDCIFLFADEAFWAGDKQAENVLKGLITEPDIPIESKGVDLKTVPNMLHVLMASNNDWVVPAGVDERRYCVLKVSNCHAQDHPYFAALVNEMDNGGLEAMLHDLLAMDISSFKAYAIPNTTGLVEQKIHSLDPLYAWWYLKLQDGELVSGAGWDDPVASSQLYDDYVENTQQISHSIRRSDQTAFGIALRKLLPREPGKLKRALSSWEPKRVWFYTLPSLEECRVHFEELIRSQIEWPRES